MEINMREVAEFFKGFGVPYPARDWAVIALVGLTLFLAGAAVGAQLFWGAQTGSIVAASADVPRAPIPVSRESIKQVIETYQARATNYQNKVFPGVTLSDPRPANSKK